MNKATYSNRIRIIIIVLLFIILIAINLENFTYNAAVFKIDEESFTIIILPDTQKYSESYPYIFSKQTKWIAKNKEKLNIVMVVHVGDIVDDFDNLKQWKNANQSLSILDENNIPYIIIPGNHDFDTSNDNYSFYDLFFPVSRFSGRDWYGGSYNNYRNNYQIISVNGVKYIFIGLDFCPSKDELKWANKVLFNNPDHKAILITHGYLGKNIKRDIHLCGSTEYIWSDFIKHHENLQFVLCGHYHSQYLRTDINLYSKNVHQILADYQTDTEGGMGFLRVMEFVPQKDKIYVKTYSPYTKSFKRGSENEFVLNYEA